MNSLVHGESTSQVEVSNISQFGVWLLTASGKELFMPYDEFPWFKNQSVKAIQNVEEPSSGQYYWPDIDVDLSEKIIENPAAYPNKAHSRK